MSRKKKVILSIIAVLVFVGTYGLAYAHGLRTAGDVDRIVAEMLTINPDADDPVLVKAAALANIVKNIDDPELTKMYQEALSQFIEYIDENYLLER